ncbi:MAG: amidohydrolase family protein, partial [Candidatus Limnocylindria bacterium]
TAVTDAGDFTADHGQGSYAALGDSFSVLASIPERLSGRLVVTANIPGAALDAAVERRLSTGAPVGDAGATRCGWIKLFADGALGSRTAALFEPYTCGDSSVDRGLMTLSAERLDDVIASGRRLGLGIAVHAIGDLANAAVLDAFERRGIAGGVVRDRVEHAQLTRAADRARMAALDLVASMQPVHCPSDADVIERCWAGREANAYAWRSLTDAGVALAFGSDAPVEPVNPWLGMHAAVNRRRPGESDGWHLGEAISFPLALRAYTRGPAHALGRKDEGHLGVGARADVAILDRPLDALLAGGDDIIDVRAELTLLDGVEVR